MNPPGLVDVRALLERHLNETYDRAWSNAIEILFLMGHSDAARLLEEAGARFREKRDAGKVG
jgi:hypothetical protein